MTEEGVAPTHTPWSNPPGSDAIFLVEAKTALEQRIALEWIESNRDGQGVASENSQVLYIKDWQHNQRATTVRQLARLLEQGELKPYFIPIRLLWMPRERNAERRARLRDFLLGDPYKPSAPVQRWIRWRDPTRCRLVVADGSAAPELITRYDQELATEADDALGKARFILRQATLALERVERRERGARYKVPRLVPEEVLDRPNVKRQLEVLGQTAEGGFPAVQKDAEECLREMAAEHSTAFIDLMVKLSRFMIRRGFDPVIDVRPEEVERIRLLCQQHPVAFLMTHKSYLDGMVMACLVYDMDLPPLHLFGGINLSFGGAGAFARRAGTIFIRRSFSDDPVYKLVMRHYIEYLVEKRFPLNWAFEGTRSRTGKLMPPKYGLLRYVVDAASQASDPTLKFVPVSIAYDQLPDLGEYVAEHAGAKKKQESYGWLRNYIRGLAKPYGRIHVRFGDALPLANFLDEKRVPGAAPDNHVIQKLAFDVACEANRVTPVTLTALVAFVLLPQRYKALTREELDEALQAIMALIAARNIPTTGDFQNLSPEDLQEGLHAIASNDLIHCHEDGPEPVYRVAPGKYITAAYYRNTMVHFFLVDAIAELALISGGADSTPEALIDRALAARELFKFEFFFPDRVTFAAAVEQNLEQRMPGWKSGTLPGSSAIEQLDLLLSHRVLRPFAEAYLLVAQSLNSISGGAAVKQEDLLGSAKNLGTQMLMQQRLLCDDAVNPQYLDNAWSIVTSRQLEGSGQQEARTAFADEVAQLCRHLDFCAAAAERSRVERSMKHELQRIAAG